MQVSTKYFSEKQAGDGMGSSLGKESVAAYSTENIMLKVQHKFHSALLKVSAQNVFSGLFLDPMGYLSVFNNQNIL